MDKRLVGRCAALGVGAALAFSATAQGATRDVQAGPFVRADAPRFERALGDANAYFVKRVTIREGDRVRWRMNGFHTVTFSPRGPRVGLIASDDRTPIAGVVDPLNAPFWFNGQPRLILNPLAAFKRGGAVYREGRVLNSGLPLDEGGPPPPYTLRFARSGTYDYYCIVHAGMDGQVKVVKRDRRIPSSAAVRREAIRQQKNVLNRVQRASSGLGATQPANTIQAGNDANDFAIYKFFPASATVKAGDVVTLRMPRRTGEVHSFTFGPNDGDDAYVNQLAAGFIAPAPGGAGPPTIVVEPRAAFPSEDPAVGVPIHVPTMHGNGFWNTGLLDSSSASVAVPQSTRVRFGTPGTYSYICVVHPFMRGSVTVTP